MYLCFYYVLQWYKVIVSWWLLIYRSLEVWVFMVHHCYQMQKDRSELGQRDPLEDAVKGQLFPNPVDPSQRDRHWDTIVKLPFPFHYALLC